MDGSNQSMFFPQMQPYQPYTPQMMNSQMGDLVDQKPVGLVAQYAADTQMMNPGGKKPAKPSKRKKKVKESVTVKVEDEGTGQKKMKQGKITEHLTVRKKRDRFNGMPEEDVVKRTLPDHLAENLDIVIVGINPGLFAAYVGHHYAGPGNHFWKCLYLSGLIPEPMNAYDDNKLLDFGIGFTNIVGRTTRGSADLKKDEIKEGAEILKGKLIKYKPKIAVFNGKGIYEVFLGNKNFYFGKQPELLDGSNTVVYVMPSSSARCAQLPRAVDKVPFYVALKKLRDHLRGDIKLADDTEITFPDLELKVFKQEKVEPVDPDDKTAKPVVKKERKKKSSVAKKSMEAPDIPMSNSWSAVKPEKSFNPADYGQMSGFNNSISSAASVAQTLANSVYKTAVDMTYTQANGLTTQPNTSIDLVNTTSTSGNLMTFGDLHTLQPMQQFYSQGSFLQQLQTPLLPEQTQGQHFPNGQNWQQFGGVQFYPNLQMNPMLANGIQSAAFGSFPGQQIQQPNLTQMQSATVKSEPHSHGYESAVDKRSSDPKQQVQVQQQQCLPQQTHCLPQQPPPLRHMQHQHPTVHPNQNQQVFLPQTSQQQSEAPMSLVVKSEPQERSYECVISKHVNHVIEPQHVQQQQRSPQHPAQQRSPQHPAQQQQLSPQHHAQQLSPQHPAQQPSPQHPAQQLSPQQQPPQGTQRQSPSQLQFTVKAEPQDQGYESAMNKSKS